MEGAISCKSSFCDKGEPTVSGRRSKKKQMRMGNILKSTQYVRCCTDKMDRTVVRSKGPCFFFIASHVVQDVIQDVTAQSQIQRVQ